MSERNQLQSKFEVAREKAIAAIAERHPKELDFRTALYSARQNLEYYDKNHAC